MGGNDHEINIEEEEEDPYSSLASSITKKELDKVRTRSPTTCIYRVPDRLRRANKEAYTPQVVSIGPIHHQQVVSIGPIHHQQSFKIMEDHKRQFLKYFLERTKKDLTHYVKIVKNSEEKLRGYYQQTFEFNSDEFCHIILVDAVFIVELFFSHYPEKTEVHLRPTDESERCSHARQVLGEIWSELLLLENQLPFFILEEIWKDATSKSIVEFFNWYHCSQLNLILEENAGTDLDKTPVHFVDMVRNLFIPRTPKSNTYTCNTLQVPNVTELHQAGVKFTKESDKNLFDISFCKGELKIPKLKITDGTDSRLRNLAAFEQCHYAPKENYICHYLIMLDCLVNTQEDVDLLVENQILENWIGDNKDVSAMINELCVGINFEIENFYFRDIFFLLNKHYQVRWNKWKAILRQDYFNTPWAAIAFLAAFVGLILTIIQAIDPITSLITGKKIKIKPR